jgi:hypothetical protein
MIAAAKQTGAITALSPATPKVFHTATVTPHSAEKSVLMEIGPLKSITEKSPPPPRTKKADNNVTKIGRFFMRKHSQ